MLDGAALVTGAAVAAVHFREFTEEMAGLDVLGWAFVAPAFAWLAVTAAGPFVFLVRRVGRRSNEVEGPGDELWMVLGLPWLIAGLLRSVSGNALDAENLLYGNALFVALFAASLFAFRGLLKDRSDAAVRRTWADRIGRVLAAAWPLQFGLGLMVTK